MRVEVLAVGTELLLGQIVDTNSAWMGEQLALAGIDSHFHQVVGDNQTRIVLALRTALARSDALGVTKTSRPFSAATTATGIVPPAPSNVVVAPVTESTFAGRESRMVTSPSTATSVLPSGGSAAAMPITDSSATAWSIETFAPDVTSMTTPESANGPVGPVPPQSSTRPSPRSLAA